MGGANHPMLSVQVRQYRSHTVCSPVIRMRFSLGPFVTLMLTTPHSAAQHSTAPQSVRRGRAMWSGGSVALVR